jgi:osmotically inducible protein OsmC
MIKRHAEAIWRGNLKEGSGSFRFGATEGRYSFASRFGDGEGSTPEELIGAASAGCFSMALSLFLGERGYTPQVIRTTSTVQLDPDQLAITRIDLDTEAEIPRVEEDEFRRIAEQAKQKCPVSKALSSVEIVLKSAKLTAVTADRGSR